MNNIVRLFLLRRPQAGLGEIRTMVVAEENEKDARILAAARSRHRCFDSIGEPPEEWFDAKCIYIGRADYLISSGTILSEELADR